ncbi:MAG: thrombospondin type 3 repeat-containing protein [Candidatus Poribacteria bacterium]|nr:thrombospondin type 3 repeat-containing protein [Candidatus Poribacteria bacterium]
MTRGGRGGKVILVTNLNDSGPGSLREAVDTEGPRIVVFTVSGTITLESRLRISHPYITIAGQTAPEDGICIRRYPIGIYTSEVIIRYIRVRLGDETDNDADAISGRYHKNIILDHVSASWSIDETVSIYHCENVTIQWCLISESLYNSGHVKGTHGFGKWFVADNVVHGNEAVTANNWDGGVQPQGGSSYLDGLKLHKPFDAIPINQQTAEEAYGAVLERVGASLPKRDAIDARIVDETRNGYATYEGVTYKDKRRVPDESKKCGIIDSQSDVGGWPELKSLPAPLDSDSDGMPDVWEKRYGFDPQDPSNTVKDTDNDGYTNIEEYLNGTDPTEFVDYTQPENNVNTLK